MGDESDVLLREILTTVKTMAEEQVGMRKDIVALQKGQESLQKSLDELRRVTSVNHYKTIGRIGGAGIDAGHAHGRSR